MSNLFPVLNTVLIICVIGLVLWHFRSIDTNRIFDELEALKLRLTVLEKSFRIHVNTQLHPPSGDDAVDQEL